MDEILDELRLLANDVLIPLDLPDEDDLVIVEEQLLLPIPKDFRHYLLTASDIIYGCLELATAADPNLHTYLPDLAAAAWSYGLPRYLLPICEIDEGYYCIDPDGIIFFWAHGVLQEQQWDNFWDWTADVWLKNS